MVQNANWGNIATIMLFQVKIVIRCHIISMQIRQSINVPSNGNFKDLKQTQRNVKILEQRLAATCQTIASLINLQNFLKNKQFVRMQVAWRFLNLRNVNEEKQHVHMNYAVTIVAEILSVIYSPLKQLVRSVFCLRKDVL